jgi:hypothetical protein
VEFAGPLYVKVGRETQKEYIALFICATLEQSSLKYVQI